MTDDQNAPLRDRQARAEHSERLRRISGGMYKLILLGVILLTLWRDALDSGVESLLTLAVPVLLVLALLLDAGRAVRAVVLRARDGA